MRNRPVDENIIRGSIRSYVRESPGNRLPSFNHDPIFEEPLVAFADGGDPLFLEYKKIIGEFHLTPGEAFSAGLAEKGVQQPDLGRLTVISWVLPISLATRVGLRRETTVPTLRWNHTRFQGQDFNFELSRHVAELLEQAGYRAVVPEMGKGFAIKEDSGGLASTWSQRHIAYVAGLGTFSLNDGFITPRGMAMRLGSVVTDLHLPATPRTYNGVYGNCLYYRNGSCGRCIKRCPAGAVSEKGHDKRKCYEYVFNTSKKLLQEMGRFEGFIGRYPACGMCQTKVPCEAMIPPDFPAQKQGSGAIAAGGKI